MNKGGVSKNMPNNKARLIAALKKTQEKKKVNCPNKSEHDAALGRVDYPNKSGNDRAVVSSEGEECFGELIPEGFFDKYNLGGRPKAFNAPFEMLEKLTAYFDKRLNNRSEVVTKDGKIVEVLDPEPVSIGDMCIFLGITNQTLNDYEGKKGYGLIIKNAKSICENDLVKRGISGKGKAGNFIEFVLKNNFSNNWKDVKTTKFEGSLEVSSELPGEIIEMFEAMGINDDDEGRG